MKNIDLTTIWDIYEKTKKSPLEIAEFLYGEHWMRDTPVEQTIRLCLSETAFRLGSDPYNARNIIDLIHEVYCSFSDLPIDNSDIIIESLRLLYTSSYGCVGRLSMIDSPDMAYIVHGSKNPWFRTVDYTKAFLNVVKEVFKKAVNKWYQDVIGFQLVEQVKKDRQEFVDQALFDYVGYYNGLPTSKEKIGATDKRIIRKYLKTYRRDLEMHIFSPLNAELYDKIRAYYKSDAHKVIPNVKMDDESAIDISVELFKTWVKRGIANIKPSCVCLETELLRKLVYTYIPDDPDVLRSVTGSREKAVVVRSILIGWINSPALFESMSRDMR